MNHNIRKRRAYCPEDSPAESALQGFTHYSPLSPGVLSLPADQRYILAQASLPSVTITVPPYPDLNRQDHQYYILAQVASALRVPLPPPPDLSNRQHHAHKRLRLNTNTPMPTQYTGDLATQDGQEKSLLAGQLGPDGNAARKPYGLFTEGGLSSGWNGTGLAECFGSFSMCQPCSPFEPQPAYQPLLTPSSYDYHDSKAPTLDTAVVSMQPQAQTSLVPTPITPDPAPLFSCDDPLMAAQYLRSYPPLQPTRVMGIQPGTDKEEMVYPTTSPVAKYDGHESSPQCDTGLGIQGQSYLGATPLQTGTMSGAYPTGAESSTYDSHSGFVDLNSRFHAQRLDVKPGAEHFGVHEGSAALDFLPSHKTTPVKRGPFRDQDQREKTALTRKMGSCIRCRMQRIRCNLDPENERGPCLSCKKIATSTRVYRLNCLRWKITDVRLYKPGQVRGQEWTDRWKDTVMDEIGSWESHETIPIQVTEGYTGKSVWLKVRRFRPQPGDRLDRTWMSKGGVKQRAELPPYAIINLDDAQTAFNRYIKLGLHDCCNHLLGPRDTLLRRTYSLALKTAADPSTDAPERTLLVALLDLWMSVRLTTKSFEIVGEETLGIPRDIISDSDSPLFGKVPIPPVMGAQIDSILIHQIQPRLRRHTLEELQKMTQAKKQTTWLTTFLATFILLHNISLITKHDADYARKHGMATRFAREPEVKEYNMGANTLLAYFHYCNKAVYPFSTECKDQDLQSLAQLDDEAISFVHFARRFVAEHKKEWEDLWLEDDYEDEYYYLSQLFEQNWQPRAMA